MLGAPGCFGDSTAPEPELYMNDRGSREIGAAWQVLSMKS